jgi:hypothetical protein
MTAKKDEVGTVRAHVDEYPCLSVGAHGFEHVKTLEGEIGRVPGDGTP